MSILYPEQIKKNKSRRRAVKEELYGAAPELNLCGGVDRAGCG